MGADALGLTIPDNRLTLDNKVFWMPHMRGLPLSWGKSFNSLVGALEHVTGLPKPTTLHHIDPLRKDRYKIKGLDPYFVFDFSDLNVKGDNAGLLMIDVQSNIKPGQHENMQVFWSNKLHGYKEEFSVRFDWSNGKMLVPLDSVPSWLLGGKIMNLRIDLPSREGSVFTIKQASLWQRSEYSDDRSSGLKFR